MGGVYIYEAVFTVQDKGQGSLSNARSSGSSWKNTNVPNVYIHTCSPSFPAVLFAPFLVSIWSIILQNAVCLCHPEKPGWEGLLRSCSVPIKVMFQLLFKSKHQPAATTERQAGVGLRYSANQPTQLTTKILPEMTVINRGNLCWKVQ